MPTAKRILQAMLPPALWAIGKDLKRRWVRSVDDYEFAPDGWGTPLAAHNEDYWTTFIARERAMCERLIGLTKGGAPVLADEYHSVQFAAYAYTLALASFGQQTVRVLDYGGGLGHYYWLSQSLVPGVTLDYHCKELPAVAAAGRTINPAVQWHTDDACLSEAHDLVLFSGSLQYVERWREPLMDAARATRYLLLSELPVVRKVPSFAATQRSGGVTNVHHQLNHSECIAAIEQAGLRLVVEFDLGRYPTVRNAPEQPTVVCWVFQRIAT